MIGKLPECENENNIQWIFTSKTGNQNTEISVDLLEFTPTKTDKSFRKNSFFFNDMKCIILIQKNSNLKLMLTLKRC